MERLLIKGPPNDIYFIIEGPSDGYFTEKVSQALTFIHRVTANQSKKDFSILCFAQ